MSEAFNPQRMEIARMRRMLSPRDLAAWINVTPTRMARWRAGLSEPTPAEITRISTALEWPRAFFFGPDLDFPDAATTSFRTSAIKVTSQMSIPIGKKSKTTLANNKPLSEGARAAIAWFLDEAPDDMPIPEARAYVLKRWGQSVADEICRP